MWRNGPSNSAQPPTSTGTYQCVGGVTKLFDNWNTDAVQGGGTAPTFSTNGQAYCVVSMATYHWNGGKGLTPGSVGLKRGSQIVGSWHAVGTTGQGGAPDVGWLVTIPTTTPVVIDGSYTCTDSDPASWSQDSASGHQGFCRVWVTTAQKVTRSP
jgi:hypothetical protein